MIQLCILFFHFNFSIANAPASEGLSELEPTAIAVQEVIADKKIQKRISEILLAVGSYDQVKVEVISGVVILNGLVDNEDQIKWVNTLASRIEGVVAVQMAIKSRPKKILDLAPAREEIAGFNVALMRQLPTLVLAIAVLIISFLLFFLASFGFRRALSKKISSPLLLSATAKILSVPIFLIGLYLALRISGLAGLAFTVLGGTGLLGLLLGLGLKNSFEDYASSILLSIKKPFRPSDWVRIGEHEGIVQMVTSRSTLIIDFSGNHILMPNSLVYNSIIINRTANPKMRCNFVFGIDYQDSIEEAQSAILNLLSRSPFVLKDPEPWVLVDELSGSAINLRVYFWLNAREFSTSKVIGHLLLEVKNLLLAEGFHFPDNQREIVFTNPLSFKRELKGQTQFRTKAFQSKTPTHDEVRAESPELKKQSQDSDLPDQGENIL